MCVPAVTLLARSHLTLPAAFWGGLEAFLQEAPSARQYSQPAGLTQPAVQQPLIIPPDTAAMFHTRDQVGSAGWRQQVPWHWRMTQHAVQSHDWHGGLPAGSS
jgi:hypothetical protein